MFFIIMYFMLIMGMRILHLPIFNFSQCCIN